MLDRRGGYGAQQRARILESCKRHWPAQQGDCSGFVRAVAKDLGVTLNGLANDICKTIQAPPWGQLGKGEMASITAGASASEGKFVIAGLSAPSHGHVAVVVDLKTAGTARAMAYWGRLGSSGKQYAPITQSWTAADLKNVSYAYCNVSPEGTLSRKNYIELDLIGGNFIVNDNPSAS